MDKTEQIRQLREKRAAQRHADALETLNHRKNKTAFADPKNAPKKGRGKDAPATKPPKAAKEKTMDGKPDHELSMTSGDVKALVDGDAKEPKSVSNFFDTIETAAKTAKEVGEVTILLTIKKK